MQPDSSRPRRKRVATGIYVENGRWIAIYRDALCGRQRSQVLRGVRNLTEAKKARRRLLADLEAKRSAPASTITVSALADEWMASRQGRVRSRTCETDARYVVLVKSFFRTRRVQDVTPGDVERFLVGLRSGTVGASGAIGDGDGGVPRVRGRFARGGAAAGTRGSMSRGRAHLAATRSQRAS